jgi:hypothetical protein
VLKVRFSRFQYCQELVPTFRRHPFKTLHVGRHRPTEAFAMDLIFQSSDSFRYGATCFKFDSKCSGSWAVCPVKDFAEPLCVACRTKLFLHTTSLALSIPHHRFCTSTIVSMRMAFAKSASFPVGPQNSRFSVGCFSFALRSASQLRFCLSSWKTFLKGRVEN